MNGQMLNKPKRDNTTMAFLKHKAEMTLANIIVQTDLYLNNFARGKP